ncbi:competence/damage-inducible protein A [Nitrolancea hollandica]|uniref:Molybdopterin binding domain n=1 Tax=Nitrolancea hollandica Lb TaxID=1129897 RepID=I4EKU6_9BACT|nr:molybdopterin-binding protein [Nitrolancea hollandica]CCF85308.1 Molybdopterin binding domain [Nitrolancea hollandica Lb]
MVKVQIVAIGNELLIGDVLDTNTNWICKKITGIGGCIDRAVMVHDSLEDISREVRIALDGDIGVIFTIGGMGPTSDDLTLEAVAKATHHPLQLNAEALAFVKSRYEELARRGDVDDASMTPAREKMAFLPEDAIPIDNPVGTAPAMVLEMGNSTVISLPGVPSELKGIFEGPLQLILKGVFGESTFLERVAIVDSKDESVLAPILKSVSEKVPRVYIKSRAKRFGPDVKFRITLSAAGGSRQEVEQQVNNAIEQLDEALGMAGISIDSIDEQV